MGKLGNVFRAKISLFMMQVYISSQKVYAWAKVFAAFFLDRDIKIGHSICRTILKKKEVCSL